MITGIAHTFYLVSDMERSVQFYRDALGLIMKKREPTWSEFEIAGGILGLLLASGKLFAGSRGGAEITLQVDSMGETLKDLRKRGVSTLGVLQERPFGWVMPLEDPDGNRLYLFQPAKPGS